MNNKSGLGIGNFIAKLENIIIQFLLSKYEMIYKFLTKKYKFITKLFVDHIINKSKLNLYSKIIILIAFFTFVVKYIYNSFIENKVEYNLDKCSFFPYLFLNCSNNKNLLSNSTSKIKIIHLDKTGEIKQLIEKNNKKRSKFDLKEENINEPFFKIFKYYYSSNIENKPTIVSKYIN